MNRVVYSNKYKTRREEERKKHMSVDLLRTRHETNRSGICTFLSLSLLPSLVCLCVCLRKFTHIVSFLAAHFLCYIEYVNNSQSEQSKGREMMKRRRRHELSKRGNNKKPNIRNREKNRKRREERRD